MELLNLETVAEEMHLTMPALRSLIDRKKFPNTKLCGRVYVERAQLSEFILLSRRLDAKTAAEYNKDIHHTTRQPEKHAPEEGARAA